MTQEDKELLLKDLCTRLPYKTFAQWHHKVLNKFRDVKIMKISTYGKNIDDYYINILCQPEPGADYEASIVDIKPYLRSMSSMTEEEIKELKALCSIYIPTDSPTIGFEDYGIVVFTHHLTNNTYSFKLSIDIIDWLNAHHFDYRGLIEKGLAIAVTEESSCNLYL